MPTRFVAVGAMLVAAYVGLVHSGAVALAAERPNIIIILADDLGYGDLSCYGQNNFTTPRLDQMAQQGLRLTQHYAGCTVCAPSRACMLSGLHMGHVYNRINGTFQFREDPLDLTIASFLKRGGYATAMIGKSGLSCNSEDGALPNRKGFDYFMGFTSHGGAHRYFPQSLWRNGAKVAYPNNHGKEGDTYTGQVFRDEVLQYLDDRANHDEPFFLHVSLQQPHADLNVPDEWRQKFVGKYEEVPYPGDHYRAEEHPKATFAAMVSYLDDSVGQILDKLRATNQAERTLVIFASDNGAMSEGGWSKDNFQSAGPLRGGKRDLYEGGIRVPGIMWWPGTIAPGTTSDHISASWDYLPTACELAGVEGPDRTDGVSLVPTLTGRGTQAQHQYLYWEFYEQGGKQAVRMGDWKGIRLDVGRNAQGPIELYDLSQDLAETNNVAQDHPDVVAKMAAAMKEAHVPSELVSFDGKLKQARRDRRRQAAN